MFKLTIATLLLSSAAMAAEVPISAVYGNDATCGLKDEATPNVNVDVGFLLRPDGLYGLETTCRPTKVSGKSVKFSCAVDDPDPQPLSATIVENKVAGTVVAHTDEFGDIALHRCR